MRRRGRGAKVLPGISQMEDDMSNANIKIVQDCYAAFGRGDVPAILAVLTDDVSFGMVGRPEDVPMAGIHQGKAGAAEFFRCLKETQEITRFSPSDFAANDSNVYVGGSVAWIMNRNGVAGENDWVHVFTFRDGKICAFRGHEDTGLLAAAYHADPEPRRAASR